jgi:hypothetical protein
MGPFTTVDQCYYAYISDPDNKSYISHVLGPTGGVVGQLEVLWVKKLLHVNVPFNTGGCTS